MPALLRSGSAAPANMLNQSQLGTISPSATRLRGLLIEKRCRDGEGGQKERRARDTGLHQAVALHQFQYSWAFKRLQVRTGFWSRHSARECLHGTDRILCLTGASEESINYCRHLAFLVQVADYRLDHGRLPLLLFRSWAVSATMASLGGTSQIHRR